MKYNETVIENLYKITRINNGSREEYPVIGKEVIQDLEFLSILIQEANTKQSKDISDAAIALYWLNENRKQLELEFNELLLNPSHYKHQKLLRYLQTDLKYESSIKYLRRLIEMDIEEFFEYSGSDVDTIIQWISWALVGIGTKEAYEVIMEYSTSGNEEIAKGMLYRLTKIKLVNGRIELVSRHNNKSTESNNNSVLIKFLKYFKKDGNILKSNF